MPHPRSAPGMQTTLVQASCPSRVGTMDSLPLSIRDRDAVMLNGHWGHWAALGYGADPNLKGGVGQLRITPLSELRQNGRSRGRQHQRDTEIERKQGHPCQFRYGRNRQNGPRGPQIELASGNLRGHAKEAAEIQDGQRSEHQLLAKEQAHSAERG